MTRDEFDRLLSAYSSGSISDADKDLLFQESLKNQELFEAFADEEHLREVLADSTFRRELIASLDSPRKPVVAWFRPWQLALGGTLASALIGTFIAWRTQNPPVLISQAPAINAPASGSPPEMPVTEKGPTDDEKISRSSRAVEPQASISAAPPEATEPLTDSEVPVTTGVVPERAAARIRTYSAQRLSNPAMPFTTTISEGKLVVNILRDGLLYVLALEPGEVRTLENGTAAISGTSFTIDPDGAIKLLIGIVSDRISDPTPVQLRLAGQTQTVTIQ